MNHPCQLIRDLLPLYRDGVCSGESAAAVEEHLKDCPDCRAYLAALGPAEAGPPEDVQAELTGAAALRSVRKRLRRRGVLIGLGAALLAVMMLFSTGAALRSIDTPVPYRDNVTVVESDGDLVARLAGDVWSRAHVSTVETEDGLCKVVSFFSTAWERLTARSDPGRTSDFVVAYADKGADEVDRVYYYAGDPNDLATPDADWLPDSAVLLWSR